MHLNIWCSSAESQFFQAEEILTNQCASTAQITSG